MNCKNARFAKNVRLNVRHLEKNVSIVIVRHTAFRVTALNTAAPPLDLHLRAQASLRHPSQLHAYFGVNVLEGDVFTFSRYFA